MTSTEEQFFDRDFVYCGVVISDKKISVSIAVIQENGKLYTSYRKQNDYAGLEALEAAVIRSLRTPIRQLEAEE